MPWRTLTLDDGTQVRVHARESGPRARPCHECGKPGWFLCDYPVNGGTCDRSMCKDHRHKPQPRFGLPDTSNIDYCEEHKENDR